MRNMFFEKVDDDVAHQWFVNILNVCVCVCLVPRCFIARKNDCDHLIPCFRTCPVTTMVRIPMREIPDK